jgi:hypothetical protein
MLVAADAAEPSGETTLEVSPESKSKIGSIGIKRLPFEEATESHNHGESCATAVCNPLVRLAADLLKW